MKDKFVLTVVGGDKDEEISDISYDWDAEKGLTGVNLLGLSVIEFLSDEVLVQETLEKVKQKLEVFDECQSNSTEHLH